MSSLPTLLCVFMRARKTKQYTETGTSTNPKNWDLKDNLNLIENEIENLDLKSNVEFEILNFTFRI